MYSKSWIRKATGALFCASAVALVGCNNSQPPASGTPASSATAAMPASSAPAPAGSAAQAAAPYTPPTADELYQLVAPIALFPDNLVAQVLAGSTYPDQITAADNVLAQSPNLKGAALQTAIAPQPWDPSVKGLTAFPSVLSQMAQNVQWTTSLGDAYVNDPTDVMNAIQVMRQRAAKQGNLRDSAQQRIVTQPVAAVDTTAYADNGDTGEPPVYNGPSVVQEPDQSIQIMPADPDTVYVPSYNPQTVYGEAVPVYPGYAYVQPAGYSTGDLIAVGAVTFGAAILVGSLFNHHDHYNNGPGWGWNNWGMHWGGGRGNGNGGGWRRPAVVYNNSTYVSRSTTVVNRYTTNNYNNRTINNNIVRNPAVANRNNFNNPGNPGNPGNRNFNNPANRGVANAPEAMRDRPGAAPASRPMSVPNFGTPVRGAEPVRNAQAGARPGRPAPTQEATQPNVSPRGAALSRNGSAAGTTRDQVRTPGQANPSAGRRPTPQSPATSQPTNRAAQQGVTRPSAPGNVNRSQPERTSPASRPAAQTQPTPRPAATRPQPAQRQQPAQERPQPQQRPQPAQERPTQQQRSQPAQERPQQQQRSQPAQQRPQPAQPRPQAAQRPQPAAQQRAQPARAPARPEKKNDKDNGH